MTDLFDHDAELRRYNEILRAAAAAATPLDRR
jgi:hypothetical protein